jgi:hypothetical protein
MAWRHALSVVATLIGAAVVAVVVLAGPPPPSPLEPATFAFAALGDAPYYFWQDIRYGLVLADMNAHDLTWVLHVGDIFSKPCSEQRYRRSLDWFNGLRHPVVYTPGDNEWFDCWKRGAGSYEPRERLRRIRELFFTRPNRSLGGRAIPLTSQAESTFPEFVENVRWSHEGVVFATVHLIGSWNGMETFPGRTAEDDEAARRRTVAAAAWLEETFEEAEARHAGAVVVAFHAAASLEEPAGDRYRQQFEPFIETLEQHVERFGRPVLAVHGDRHVYTVDHPLVRRTTGRRLENFTRLEVPGFPDLGWTRVVVKPGPSTSFSFEPRIVPMWKVR